ncbi:hypothetical protein ABT369_28275 [Dactylosporangium sp. NPDC000244]|uniref:hypothetical protein n=1 Tax=Dactylosporangium sp. NPDC000244 TaxID=3154365 RepID=UPI0033259662
MTTVDLSILADLLTDELGRHCADPSPVRDSTELDVVDQNAAVSMPFAERYVARRMTHALQRLRTGLGPGEEAWKSGDAVHDGLIVLGAYAHLQGLKAQVAP